MTVDALRRRRPEVLDDLLATYGREIQAVAWLILRDRADAEDVTVETLLTAWDRILDLRQDDALRPWLLRIATNLEFNGPEAQMSVTVTGRVSYEIRIEGNDALIDLPELVLKAGGSEVEMLPECFMLTPSWSDPISDSCPSLLPDESLDALQIAAGEVATMSLEGWTITDATVRCGRLISDGDHPGELEPMPGCAIEAEFDGGRLRLIGAEPSPEPWLVQLNLTARNRAGDAFENGFWASLLVR
jgi:hypothetical protein